MTRYTTQVVNFCDNTSKAAWACSLTCTINLAGAGTCVFQLAGGTGGCSDSGNLGSGVSCSWTVPSGAQQIIIEIWGGGGGGAAGPNCNCCSQSSGGGGGAYSRKTLSVTPGSVYTLCAGGGGQGNVSATAASACGCGGRGSTTYVTGLGLSNFCAEGGWGGESRAYLGLTNQITPNGGFPGSGGDLNVRGYDGGKIQGPGMTTYCAGWSWGGGSPFGGRNIYIGFDYSSLYNDAVGSGKAGGVCGFCGSFPGGGGAGSWTSCCCGICACGGNGAAGLIRIWM